MMAVIAEGRKQTLVATSPKVLRLSDKLQAVRHFRDHSDDAMTEIAVVMIGIHRTGESDDSNKPD
jgi:hypothetical protein